MEAEAPLAKDPIMLGRSIHSFRDLEHQNLSIISDSIDSARCGQIMSGTLIQSFRHLECQYPSIISDSIDSARCGKKSRTAEWNEVQCVVLEF